MSLPRLEAVEYELGAGPIRPFDPSADYFERRVEFDRQRMLDLVEEIRRHSTGRRVLDLGAAPYILDAALLQDGFDVTLTGLPFGEGDRGTATLTIEGTSHECRIDLFDVEADEFPYPASSFDLVIAGEIFEHLYRRPWHLLAEAWRCLADAGVLVLSTPNSERLEQLYAWWRRMPSGLGFHPDAPTLRHAREYGPSEIRAILESQGFEVIDIRTPSYSHIVDGFPGLLGGLKHAVYRSLKKRGGRKSGLLAYRGDSLIAVARKNPRRSPGDPPEFMLYAIADPRTGYNFSPDVEATAE